jgi:hypothetical protein
LAVGKVKGVIDGTDGNDDESDTIGIDRLKPDGESKPGKVGVGICGSVAEVSMKPDKPGKDKDTDGNVIETVGNEKDGNTIDREPEGSGREPEGSARETEGADNENDGAGRETEGRLTLEARFNISDKEGVGN